MMKRSTQWMFALAILTLTSGVLTGCVRMAVLPLADEGIDRPLAEPRPTDELTVPLEKDPTKMYRVGPNDVLRVDVRKDPTLSQLYTVTAEGNVLLPNIGPVLVSDMTTQEIERGLNEMLTQFIREPDVKVGVQDYRSKVIWVIGQVNKPGPQVMRADVLKLHEAIYAAGLPGSEAALKRTRVITPDDKSPIVRQIDLTGILYEGRMAEDILLEPNDIVYVPARYSSNLSAAIRELIKPAQDITSLRARMNMGDNNSNNNN
jgi:polysaccharide export outer membrane protein